MRRKKIIFICPSYFKYHLEIKNVLNSLYDNVIFFKDFDGGFIYNIFWKSKFLFNLMIWVYRKFILFKISYTTNIKDILIIKGNICNADLLKNFKRKLPQANFFLYQWDSMRNHNYFSIIQYFDKVYSFDKTDCSEHELNYLPLFFSKSNYEKIEEDIDLLFIGIWHSDRVFILREIQKFAVQNNLKCIIKVYYSFLMYLYLVYVRRFPIKSDFFIFKKLNQNKVYSLYKRAKCIIDINHPQQVGLTMRTIEAIGLGKKLITTNINIKSEPFFDSQMISVISREKIDLDLEFLKSEKRKFKHIDALELNNWVKKILELN